jgi:hypothetical protein
MVSEDFLEERKRLCSLPLLFSCSRKQALESAGRSIGARLITGIFNCGQDNQTQGIRCFFRFFCCDGCFGTGCRIEDSPLSKPPEAALKRLQVMPLLLLFRRKADAEDDSVFACLQPISGPADADTARFFGWLKSRRVLTGIRGEILIHSTSEARNSIDV